MQNFILILGGLAIFLHGLQLAREGLQLLAGDKLRSIVAAVTGNRVTGLFIGALVTMIIQSSTATTSMLVGFASSGILTLAQAMAVLLGADIGTTVTVQLISFRLANYALLVAFVGFVGRHAAKRRKLRYLGQGVMGFGLLFFGMKLMADGAGPLTQSDSFSSTIAYFTHNPLVGVLAAALLTVLLQGSAPAIGLIITMAHAGGISLEAAIPMVLGANLGTTVTPALSAVGSSAEGKRVAVAHSAFKLLGVILVLPLVGPFARLVSLTSGDLSRQIANAHSFFNIGLSLVFLPFTSLAATAITRFYVPAEDSGRFRPKYLDPQAIETPSLAMGNAAREFLRMADIVGDMLKDSLRVFEKGDLDLLADVEARDDKVDILNKEIRFYLARLAQENMSSEQAQRQMSLITCTADLENAGDIINKNLLPMARKKITHNLSFSEKGWAEIREFHRRVVENFDLALACFSTGDEELARKVMRHKAHFQEYESQLRVAHIARLHKGTPESLETSSIHLDVLSNLRRVNSLISNLAEAVLNSRPLTSASVVES